MVAPGADRVKAGGERGAELGEDLFVFELGVPALVFHLHHAEQDEHRVYRPPGFGLVHEQAEFGGEGVLVGGDEGVDAAGVVLEEAAVAIVEAGDDVFGCGAHLEQALHAVVGDEAFA